MPASSIGCFRILRRRAALISLSPGRMCCRTRPQFLRAAKCPASPCGVREEQRPTSIMAERILLLTGHLAYQRLLKTMTGLGPTPFAWQVFDIGVKVAALMTDVIIRRRLPQPLEADRIIVPGRCRADLTALSRDLGVKVERGPDEIADLPAYFGRGGRPPDLSRYDI